MDSNLARKLLPVLLKSKGQAEISVTGVSMHPTLYEGDRITVLPCVDYAIGDILVFTYQADKLPNELLVHRLLEKAESYFCKGDNAFRLEKLAPSQVFGKVTHRNGEPIALWPEWKIALSHQVNRTFAGCQYSVAKTKQTAIYMAYKEIVLMKGECPMTYQRNANLDYIQTDETSLAVFDPESGDTHFFDETGIDILNTLIEPCELDVLLNRLCTLYDAAPEEIRPDVEEFLADTVGKNVVKVL